MNVLSNDYLYFSPVALRTKLAFNEYDTGYDVDRRSCMGPYQIEHGLPLNPKRRNGQIGRGILCFWGPNHAIVAVVTKFKKNSNGSFALDSKNRKILQILVGLTNENEYELPVVSKSRRVCLGSDRNSLNIKRFLL